MKWSESRNEIAAALAKAQGAMKPAIKDSQNPHFKSSYADLASAWEACRAALAANGLAVIQGPESDDGSLVSVTTCLMHSSGQWCESDLRLRVAKADAQGLGSLVTYLRRYALMAMVGIAPDDDDGNAAAQMGQKSTPKPRQDAPPPPPRATQPDAEDGRAKARAWLDNVLPKVKEVDSQQALNRFTDTNRATIDKLNELYPDLYAELDEALAHTVESFLSGG